VPQNFEFSFRDDWDHFEQHMGSGARAFRRSAAGIKQMINGPSPSRRWKFLLGEAPEVRNLFVGAGSNAFGIASGSGAGVLADWVDAGEQPLDLWVVDIRRFSISVRIAIGPATAPSKPTATLQLPIRWRI
jgi:4-methylaminobutanoate oxidase (formaldehyde-forming)